MSAPTCVTCGNTTYYIAEDRKHYCLNHISDQESSLFDKDLTPEIVRRARALYSEAEFRASCDALYVEDEDWEDLDLWFNVGYFWDLNIFTSRHGLLCATLYPVSRAGNTITKKGYNIVSDPSVKEIEWIDLPKKEA